MSDRYSESVPPRITVYMRDGQWCAACDLPDGGISGTPEIVLDQVAEWMGRGGPKVQTLSEQRLSHTP